MRLGDVVYKFQWISRRFRPQRTLGIYTAGQGIPKGRALVSYLPLPFIGNPAFFRGHSSVWESSEIVRIFNRLGYVVDLIAWDDAAFQPSCTYDMVLDIHRNLVRCSGDKTRKVFHVTGSYPEFSNRSEEKRLAALNERRNVALVPRRAILAHDLPFYNESLALADLITLIGNEVTAATFPHNVQRKIRQVIATGAWFPPEVESSPLTGNRRDFLWFNGGGAIHKGLDLVLEIFACHPELTLHVVGPYLKELDFVNAYRKELFQTRNIVSHGFLFPSDRRFLDIASRAGAFLNPSCSEGISTSAITCMQAGIIPIISENCGISLPLGCGYLLHECSFGEIESAVLSVAKRSDIELHEMATAARSFAYKNYSRERFTHLMEEALASVSPF